MQQVLFRACLSACMITYGIIDVILPTCPRTTAFRVVPGDVARLRPRHVACHEVVVVVWQVAVHYLPLFIRYRTALNVNFNSDQMHLRVSMAFLVT